MTTPPIEPSPTPKTASAASEDADAPGTITGVFRALDSDLGRLTKWLVFIGIIGGGIMAIMGIASAQTKQGLEVIEQKQALDVQALADHKEEEKQKWAAQAALNARQEERNEVVNKKLDLLLDAARVPLYRRPDYDGGTP